MGEAVVSCEEVLNLEEVEKEKERDASASVLERFLPRMVLRVLLVEADDSTRQIIAALLRKCSYRAVASVSDGLKAWEVLKGNPHDIDLILMEVELPSISGFALLTLIMEHEICRNIPVIMMSPHDSVSTVYNCMLRGAADFLVKPVRKNELGNLWQHVWRRKASASCGHCPQNESDAQQKVEATAENNTMSNHSSGIKRNRECIEKGSDDQSSCTMPDMEAKRSSTEHVQDLLQQNWSRSPSSDMKMNRNEECLRSNRNLLMDDCEESGLVVDSCKDANAMTTEEQVNIISEVCDNNQTLVNSSREAIDFIGAFGNSPKCNDNHNTNQVDSSPLLDLSLRRSHPNDSVNQVCERRPTLNHSDASAFSYYVCRAFQPLHLSASVSNQQKDSETISERQLSNCSLNHNSHTNYLPPSSDKAMLTLAHDQSGQAESAFPCPRQPVPLVPVSVRDIRFEGLRTAYGSVVRPIFSTKSSPSPLQSPVSACHSETSFRFNAFHQSSPETKNSGQFDNLISQNATVSINESEHKQGDNSESSDDQCHFSCTTHQTANNSFCHAAVNHINSIGSGSNENVNQIQVIVAASEGANEEVFPIDGRNYHRSVEREAALTKFRLKRKDRCFEKKVRYESRKKLAEQRPRVKGQFVRRSQADLAPPETNH